MSVIKIWKEKGRILEGILNYIFTKQDVEDVATERMAVCNKCEELDRKGKSCVMPGTAPCCKLCGCCMALKTRAMSAECDLGKWKSLMSEEEEDLLNEHIQ